VILLDSVSERAKILAISSEGIIHDRQSPIDLDASAQDYGESLTRGEIHYVPDTGELTLSPLISALWFEGLCSYINVPLLSQGKLIGLLNLGMSRPNGFTRSHLDIACEVSDQMAIAIHNA